MAVVERTFSVPQEPSRVIAFLRDLQTTEQWDPGTVSTPRLTPGPVAVGTQWRNTSKLFGVTTELLYTLVFESCFELRFVGDNRRAHTVDTITVLPHNAGSLITYRFEVIMKGWSKLSAPLMRLAFEHVGNLVVHQMTGALGRHAKTE